MEGVTHAYGRNEVLHDIDVTFDDGVTLLLGPNGAGKSTLLEIMASVRRPSRGAVLLPGSCSPGPGKQDLRRFRQAVAWLPQAISIYPGVNVREYVALSGWLKGMTRGAAWEASTRALEQVALSGRAQDSVSKLSGGQRRRLGIAGAIVHDAQVILLDEPTANLDPAQRRRFRDTLQTLNEERTVIVSSHDTEDAQDAYSSVFLLNDGTFRFRGSTEQFMSGTDIALPTSQRMQASYERWVGAEE